MVFITLSQADTLRPEKSEPEDATQIVKTILSKTPVEYVESKAVLKVRAPKSKTKSIPIRFEIKPVSKTCWECEYETLYPEGTQELLRIRRYVDKPNEYFISTRDSNEAEWNTKQIPAGKETAVGFAGTEFWYCDLGMEFFQWEDQKLIKREMKKGRPCRVLRSTCAAPEGEMYSSVVSYIDNETDGVLIANGLDKDKKRIKEFEIQSFQKIDGMWQLKKMTIYNNKTSTRTTLEIEY